MFNPVAGKFLQLIGNRLNFSTLVNPFHSENTFIKTGHNSMQNTTIKTLVMRECVAIVCSCLFKTCVTLLHLSVRSWFKHTRMEKQFYLAISWRRKEWGTLKFVRICLQGRSPFFSVSRSVIAYGWSMHTRQALSPSWIKHLQIRRSNLGFPLNWQAWQIPPNLEMPLTWNVGRLCSNIIELACTLQTAGSLKISFLSFLHKLEFKWNL